MGTRTPWGTADSSKCLARGVMSYSTPGHGGYHLSSAKNAKVHEAWRRKDGWYEEDCEWSIVALTFPELFTRDLDLARSCAKNWYPDAYTAVTRLPVALEDSSVLRKRAFEAAHASDYVATSAFGDWAVGVPDGMVGVFASPGGKDRAAEKCFLVPADEYGKRGEFGFVVDVARHAECAAFSGATKVRYRIHEPEVDKVWTSEPYDGDEAEATKAVLAGYLAGNPRWATDARTGQLLYGLDAKGRELSRIPPPPVVTYTTAPADYDWFGTRELDAWVGSTKAPGSKKVRKVVSPADEVENMRARYSSGLHMAVDETEWKKLVDYKLVTLSGPALATTEPAVDAKKETA